MARMVKTRDAITGEIKDVDFDSLITGPIRTPNFSDALLQRIRAVHASIKEVYCNNLEEFEIGFMRDAHPEREVAVWEHIAAAYVKAKAAMPDFDRSEIIRTLVLRSMGGLSPQERAHPDVKKIIDIAEGK